jgi:hypothetical protein
MDERWAADMLGALFYQWIPSRVQPGEVIACILDFGRPVVPTPALQFEMDARRAELLPKDFRFTWPNLPQPGRMTAGARYIELEEIKP